MSELIPIFNTLMRQKSGALLLVIQIAITAAIVSNASYIIHERLENIGRPSGVPEHELFMFSIYTFGEDSDSASLAQIDTENLRALPGVKNAVAVNSVPLLNSGSSNLFRTQPAIDAQTKVLAAVFHSTDQLLDTFGVQLIAGRNFYPTEVLSRSDRETGNRAGVVLVTEALAKDLFPQGDALGRNIYTGETPLKIIGIIKHLQGSFGRSDHIDRTAVLPNAQQGHYIRYAVRAHPAKLSGVIKQVEDLILETYPHRVVQAPKTFKEVRRENYRYDQMMADVMLLLILMLLTITALGTVGLAAFNVGRRTRQIGTRRALGARKRHIALYFIGENWLISCMGMAVGIILALVLNHWLMQQFALERMNFAYLLATLVGIWLIGQAAVLAPALRAANISPSIATRTV